VVDLRRTGAGGTTGPFDAFLDDAAVFPPGNASLEDAVRAHVARQGTDVGALVGPVVLPASLLPRVEVPLAVAVVADEPFEAPDHLRVVAVETREPGAVEVPAGACLVVETTWDRPLDAPAGALVKLRTGGADVAAFPSPARLATALAALVRAERPFKLTAGLHRAVRATDPDDGLTHHGFANVLLAVDALLSGARTEVATSVLAREDEAVGPDLVALGDDRLRQVRRLFTSVGTCSIDDPAADLARLGLLRAAAGTEG
jgi:hypothetical protein